LVGEVQASGKRLTTFQTELAGLYKTQLRNTEVVVSLETSVLVSGSVNKPGRVVFERPLTVLDAVMEAGGIAPAGDPKRVHLIRLRNGRHETQIFDLRSVLRGDATNAFYVKGGDVIYVEERFF
jgi:protein involved in polysaccharide export with SLBB domain